MSEIPSILEKLQGTSLHDVLVTMENAYERIYSEQSAWYDCTRFVCPSGCGKCCENFEPDLFEGEALYMGAWLLENQRMIAMQIANGTFPFDNGEKTCPLFNPSSPYHCSIYGGRAFICRLFGAAAFRSRIGEKVWRPCKFYAEDILSARIPPVEHKQYNEEETVALLGAIPPVMSDMVENARTSCASDEETRPLREVLPKMIQRILWVIEMNGNDNPNGSPSGAPLAA